jgi:hypothetical protein
MSALGQNPTYAVQQPMSALPPKADMCVALTHVCFGPIVDMERELKSHAWLQAYAYLEVASGSIPLFLIVSEARGEARNSISRLEPSMSPEPATTAAENV